MPSLAEKIVRLDAADRAAREDGIDENMMAKRRAWRDACADDVRRSPVTPDDLDDVADFAARMLRLHGAGALPYLAPIVAKTARSMAQSGVF